MFFACVLSQRIKSGAVANFRFATAPLFCPEQFLYSALLMAAIDMTLHYLHVQKEVKEVAADKLDRLFKKRSKNPIRV